MDYQHSSQQAKNNPIYEDAIDHNDPELSQFCDAKIVGKELAKARLLAQEMQKGGDALSLNIDLLHLLIFRIWHFAWDSQKQLIDQEQRHIKINGKAQDCDENISENISENKSDNINKNSAINAIDIQRLAMAIKSLGRAAQHLGQNSDKSEARLEDAMSMLGLMWNEDSSKNQNKERKSKDISKNESRDKSRNKRRENRQRANAPKITS